jgi:hypothetical protein
MSDTQLYIGSTPIHRKKDGGLGEFVRMNGETWSKISGLDAMETFFMTVVSSSDHWMFIASNGSLTAGRKNPESALFPYYTDDKIMDMPELTGSKTIIKATVGGKTFLWEPFSDRYAGAYDIQRNLYKSKFGNKVQFEEFNLDLGLAFRYTWAFSDDYGFVKYSELENISENTIQAEVLDGLQNLLPYGVGSSLQGAYSTLVDAYKKNELVRETGLGIFSLSAMIVDKAEPSEALRATTVWSKGLPEAKYLLSSDQLDGFRRGEALMEEDFTKAVKAAYFVNANINLEAKTKHAWRIVAEVEQSSADVIDLNEALKTDKELLAKIDADVVQNTLNLERLVSIADGMQKGRDKLTTTRHYSNVLFNIMRGGIFEDQYNIDSSDLVKYVKTINKKVYAKHNAFFTALPKGLTYGNLLVLARGNGNPDLLRICAEYLPISFSRRHGDPSRPWNSFNIDLIDENGHKKHNYEGNWRDIFQNWEALAYSFPEFIEGMITKFANASTIDGYNPYRITREGIDWETIEPDDPWSYIGYWGDHQIIYLQKLLEHAERHYPGKLDALLTQKNFVYANVPYRIRSYGEIKKNPNDTIDFDQNLEHTIGKRVEEIGADGKMIWNGADVLKANFTEKLLVMALTKLYNFVPDGGIWLNTQRPEWNDANNALVGNGLSMVTLNYLRRFLVFANDLLGKLDGSDIELNEPVAVLLNDLHRIFTHAPNEFSPESRQNFVDELGMAGEKYRTAAYQIFSGKTLAVSVTMMRELFGSATALAERSIANSKRQDGLYHAYNLLAFDAEGAKISPLYEMLEGQVAALSSGVLTPYQALNILDSLKASAMYRADQYSYMLYPNRVLASFIAKNNIPESYVEKSALLKELVKTGDTRLVVADAQGGLHFAGGLHNANDVQAQLDELKKGTLADLASADEQLILAAFEEVFNHVAFTGRSGTFYGYEGLGSIYWHMVSKLLLAVQENIYRAVDQHADAVVMGKLTEHYYEIRAGIGINKTPKLYGAFPTDAYSHTPGNAGAQQPGLTGQVKEDVLNRWAVLGVQVRNGKIEINPVILNRNELLLTEESFTYAAVDGQLHKRIINANQLAFTYCGTLFTYSWAEQPSLRIIMGTGEEIEANELVINQALSAEIFGRSGKVKEVQINYPVR